MQSCRRFRRGPGAIVVVTGMVHRLVGQVTELTRPDSGGAYGVLEPIGEMLRQYTQRKRSFCPQRNLAHTIILYLRRSCRGRLDSEGTSRKIPIASGFRESDEGVIGYGRATEIWA
jgi:hypothetical protein